MSKVMNKVVNAVKSDYGKCRFNYYRDLSKFQESKGFTVANNVAHSRWYDLLGCAIVTLGFLAAGYFSETIYTSAAWKSGSVVAHNPISIAVAGVIPFGFISLISALSSLMSDRFAACLSNASNWISIPSVLLSMYIDTMLGNRAAPLTFSVTFVISIIATIVWHYTGKYNVNKPKLHGKKAAIVLVIALIISFAFSLWSNVYGYGVANAHGAIFWTSTIAFALSLVANVAQMFKYQMNNQAWLVYDVVQIAKSFAEFNIPYVVKYLYYMVNTLVALISWSDKGRMVSKHAEISKAA